MIREVPGILEKIENIDRRYIFLLVFIVVIIPLVKPLKFDVGVSKPVRDIYEFVESLPPKSVIWMGFDYYNSTRTECDAQAIAFLRHVFSKNHRVFVTSVIPDGQGISQNVVTRIASEYDKEYGKDYVILGYKPGTSIVMIQVCQNIRSIYNQDAYGKDLDELPMMNKIKNYKDIAMLFTATDNASFDYYVQVASTQYHIPMAGGSTAVSVPQLYIYINSGQAIGVLGGLKGAAEYEKLIDRKDTATAGMDAQSFVHVLIVLMIIFSNGVYFFQRIKNGSKKF